MSFLLLIFFSDLCSERECLVQIEVSPDSECPVCVVPGSTDPDKKHQRIETPELTGLHRALLKCSTDIETSCCWPVVLPVITAQQFPLFPLGCFVCTAH